MSTDHIDVKIMNRDYRIACAADDQDQLLRVVTLVDEKMTQIASKTKNMIPERIAVMAAMSIAQELLTNSTTQTSGKLTLPPSTDNKPITASAESNNLVATEETVARLNSLALRIDNALQEVYPSSTPSLS